MKDQGSMTTLKTLTPLEQQPEERRHVSPEMMLKKKRSRVLRGVLKQIYSDSGRLIVKTLSNRSLVSRDGDDDDEEDYHLQ